MNYSGTGAKAANDSTGTLLQAAWLGLGGIKSIAATSVRASHTRPTCTKSVRAYLMGVRRPATMHEVHAAVGDEYTLEELSSALSKLRGCGYVGQSERVRIGEAKKASARRKLVKTYWWVTAPRLATEV